jgi:cytochrome P450
MFSVGTIVMRCVDLCEQEQIDYAALNARERMQFVVEAQRLHPTVTSVHRILEEDEEVRVCGVDLKLRPGDEVAYPFACINRDPTQFEDCEKLKINRSREESERVLSWSVGPHVCPAKDLSVLSIVMMLDALAENFTLSELKIFNPEF